MLVNRNVALAAAVVAPLAACVVLAALRAAAATLNSASAALVLVLVVVAVACLGHRGASLVAAVVAGLGFDYFLTAPYLTLSITDAADVETLVALLLVGIAITEVVRWGQRYRTRLSDREAYLTALLAISGRPPGWREAVARHLVALLDLDECEWAESLDAGAPRLDRDGEVRLGGHLLPVADGLPVHSSVVLPLRPDDPASPGFVLTASTHVARPPLRARRLAAALADQVGWVMARQH